MLSDKNEDYFDNTVYFEINKDLRESDKNQMISYFQSEKSSGGGEIIQYKFDKTINSLEIVFREGACKREILKRKFFKFKSYEINACESPALEDENSKYNKYENVLLISNIDDEKKVDEYLSNLVQNRNVIKKVKSIIHENLTFVQFNDEIDIEEVKKRFNLRKTFEKKVIQISEAFETFSVLVKIDSKYLNENYLNSRFKLENFMYWQLPFEMNNSPFLIVKFSDIDFKFDFLLKYSKIEDKEYLIENNFNFNLLNEYLNNQFNNTETETSGDEMKKLKGKKAILNCNQCPFIGSSRPNLAKHKKSHIFSKENLVKCKYCDFFAKTVFSILSHEKLHKKTRIAKS
jgi:hypothetical protein